MSTLPAREAYRRWAPTYESETAVSFLETRSVAALGISTAGRRLLDVGCGTARRLRDATASLAVGVDLTAEMLLRAASGGELAAADGRSLPFSSESFDVVWCRLMIGHVPSIRDLFAELARVCRDGGSVVVTDLAVEAVHAGHRRTFRASDGTVLEVEHHVHSLNEQVRVAHTVRLVLEVQRTEVVGPEIRRFYDDAGRLALYEQQQGLPLVTALAFRKQASA